MSRTTVRLDQLELQVKAQREWTTVISKRLGLSYTQVGRYSIGTEYNTQLKAGGWVDVGDSGLQIRIRLSDAPGTFWVREKPKDGR